ncbi:MAG: hypothetical protein H6841_08775 [Planctomycetes bacterium]|nr:hypothetical protein [Planctomycetota bacterium]MCB9936151.1 hypothetical protein [Planctomycetota bacterium]
MRYLAFLLLVLLSACASTGTSGGGSSTDGIDPESEGDQIEREAYDVTGDVRVYYYVKGTLVPGAGGRQVEQEELRHTLINRSHTFYAGLPDHQMKKEERFLYNADMYDLLKILKELGFFEKGNSVNILADDPIARADAESRTTRVIAVEVIKDGKVNTSYFARRDVEHEIDKDRARLFNDCQAVVLQAVAGALPRGEVGYGEGDTNRIHERR